VKAYSLTRGVHGFEAKSGYDQEAVDFIKKYGLTEAEVLALKLYSAEEFEIINPVMSNRLELTGTLVTNYRFAQRKRGIVYTDEELRERIRLIVRNHQVHINAGLNKLPHKRGWVYRGTRFTPQVFKAIMSQDDYTYTALTSVSTDIATGKDFAGRPPDDANKTVSVLFIMYVKSARDFSPISEHRSESEWIVMPGTTFKRVKAERVEGEWEASGVGEKTYYKITQEEW
jgi:hypothetical protein